MRRLLPLLFLFCTGLLQAAPIAVFELPDAEAEKRFRSLSEELRCLVCQNQSLADSNAELALDLRREVHRMIVEGKSDEEILDFMVQRYGDFVLYDPPLRTSTLLLWGAPLLLLVIGLLVLWRQLRTGPGQTGEGDQSLSDEERKRLAELMNDQAGER